VMNGLAIESDANRYLTTAVYMSFDPACFLIVPNVMLLVERFILVLDEEKYLLYKAMLLDEQPSVSI
jgi:hypothetical protein